MNLLQRIFNKSNFKNITLDLKSGAGFTVIELMVVIAIMGLVVGFIIIDFYRLRDVRDLKIAQNELVTNLRKVQSAALFSRNTGDGKTAQYQIIKFSSSTPDQYFVQAIADAAFSPKLYNQESIKLPRRIQISSLSLTGPIWALPVSADCVLLAFRVPYGQTYLNNGCIVTDPAFQIGDSYKKILDHISNIPGSTISTDADLIIKLAQPGVSGGLYVIVRGVTGLICPSSDGIVCGY